METFKVKSMYFIKSDNFGLTPVFILEDGREINGKWSPTGSCYDFSFELIKTKICRHPDMQGDCINDKKICCKYCNQVKECLNNFVDTESLCPFIENENDLKEICPFEKEVI